MTEEKLGDTCRKMVERLAVAPTEPISNLTPGQKETIASLLFVAYEKGRDEGRVELLVHDLKTGCENAMLVNELRQKLTASEAENRRYGLAVRELSSDLGQLFSLLDVAELAMLQALGEEARGMSSWRDQIKRLKERRR